MVVETQLPRTAFRQIALIRHFQRVPFYLAASVCAILTALALVQGQPLLLLVAWPPFLLYILTGVLGVVRASRTPDLPVFLPTRYHIDASGIGIRTAQGESQIPWSSVVSWKLLVGCYVITLESGQVLAIPQRDVLPHRRAAFEQLLREHINRA